MTCATISFPRGPQCHRKWQADRVSSFYVSLRRANISLPTLSHSWGLMCLQSFPTPHLSEIGGVMNADGWYHLPFS